jgi:hypothetical protein
LVDFLQNIIKQYVTMQSGPQKGWNNHDSQIQEDVSQERNCSSKVIAAWIYFILTKWLSKAFYCFFHFSNRISKLILSARLQIADTFV